MQIIFDPQLCEGYEECIKHCKDVFERGEEIQVHVRDNEPPEALRTAVEKAIRFCPKGALSLLETDKASLIEDF